MVERQSAMIKAEQCKSRKDFKQLMMQLINPLKPYYSEGKAGLYLGHTSAHYENTTVPMEAFSRPLWGLVPLWAGGGEEKEFEEIYRKGLSRGSDPNSIEYWKKCRDYDQKFVEMAAIAYGILMTPDKLWNPLPEEEKESITDWLNEINQYECPDCNWFFFCILVNVALKKNNRRFSQERLINGLEKIESYYLENGWYKDGKIGQKDYYISFAIHFYSIVYAEFMEEEDKERCDSYRKRAKLFAQEFVYWFAEDGSSLPYGRSLTYRFAQAAFFSACVGFKLDVLPKPVMKGIIVRHLDDWLSAPIFDHIGILTIGYKYPNLQMSEDYNAPGSPYWAMKTFAFLTLPESDEFYRIEAAPLPELDTIKRIACGDMIIARSSGHVTAFVPGMLTPHQHAHTEEKYCKFAYSTRYGFSIPRSQKTLTEAATDSMLAFEVFGHIYVKGMTTSYSMVDNFIEMKWSPVKGIDVVTKIDITETTQIRSHEITSEYDCKANDCGFAVSKDDVTGFPERRVTTNHAFVKNGDENCEAEILEGNGRAKVIDVSPNTNLIHSKTVIPAIEYEIRKGINRIVTMFKYS